MMNWKIVGTCLLWIAACPGVGSATLIRHYQATLVPINNSGVSGRAFLTLDGDLLTVRIQAAGVEEQVNHPQYIFGRFDSSGNPIDSVLPPASADLDGNGFLLNAGDPTKPDETGPYWGRPILPLTSPPGAGPTYYPPGFGGVIDFVETYDLSQPSLFVKDRFGNPLFDADDLLPLEHRVIALHGMGVPAFVCGSTADYCEDVPIAAGEIMPAAIPEPSSLALFGAAIVGLMGFRRRKATRPRAGAPTAAGQIGAS